MSTTMRLIAKNVLGSDTASVTFSDIPGTYTDLCVMVTSRGNGAATTVDVLMRINSDSGSNYSHRTLYGNGTSAFSGSNFYGTTKVFVGSSNHNSNTANTFSSTEIYLPNYAGATNKSLSTSSGQETNATLAYVSATAGLWSSTAAITSLTFSLEPTTESFKSGSSFFLYGITKA